MVLVAGVFKELDAVAQIAVTSLWRTEAGRKTAHVRSAVDIFPALFSGGMV